MATVAITQLSAQEMAQHIAAGEFSSREAIDAHIERIEAVNPQINAVVVRRFDEARAEADGADQRRARGQSGGALHGVPVTVKECLDLEGTPSTFGLSARAAHRATRDELHVSRLRGAGAIFIAKTNVSQLLFYTEADNPLYGRTRNPWNLERTPGGSSGGEGAIIASGGSPLGLGTDIGGSVRVPAAFCGIASLKPTAGRFPDPGRFSVPAGQQAIPSQVGVLARTVRDVALGTRILNGGRALADCADVDLGALRVACYADDGSFEPSPAVRRAVDEASAILRSAGAQVTPWMPHGAREALLLLGRIFTADGLKGMKRALADSPRTPQIRQLMLGAALPRGLRAALKAILHALGQPTMAFNLEAFVAADTDTYWRLVEALIDYRERFAAALDAGDGGPFDLILAPPCALPAFTHGATRDLLTAGAYAALYNVLGYPAGVVPVSRVRAGEESVRTPGSDQVQKLAQRIERGSVGLPVAVQVIARPWQEHIALAAMQAIESAARASPDYPATPIDPATIP